MGSAIGEAGLTVLASEEGGGTSNFLIPNGTFFFVLAIFLIVLFVIGKFVVPPVQKVLGEREAMIARTTEETRKAAQQEAAADADYRKELGEGRSEAAAIRDEARAEGRAVVDEKRALANDEVAGTVRVGTSASTTVTLSNTGDAPLTPAAHRAQRRPMTRGT